MFGNFPLISKLLFFITSREIEKESNSETPERNRETPDYVPLVIHVVILLSIGVTIILATLVIHYLKKGTINWLIFRVMKC